MMQRKLRVLAADDDPTMVILLRAVLQAPAFELVVACDGAGALRAAGGDVFDIALLDVEMPEVDGLQVAAMLRRQFGERLCIVLLTGREDAEFVAAQRRLQAQHLSKPVDWTQLPQLLQRWADGG